MNNSYPPQGNPPGYAGFTTKTDQTAFHASNLNNGQVYRNTGNTPIFATVTVNLQGTGQSQVMFYADFNANPTQLVGQLDNITSGFALNIDLTCSFVVLPGQYYKSTKPWGTALLIKWIEWS